jgi:hypothetical protein
MPHASGCAPSGSRLRSRPSGPRYRFGIYGRGEGRVKKNPLCDVRCWPVVHHGHTWRSVQGGKGPRLRRNCGRYLGENPHAVRSRSLPVGRTIVSGPLGARQPATLAPSQARRPAPACVRCGRMRAPSGTRTGALGGERRAPWLMAGDRGTDMRTGHGSEG